MDFLDLIIKKRNGERLTPEEIGRVVSDYVDGSIPDYQMSAFLMAAYFKGLDREETAGLTRSMVNSGSRVDLSEVSGFKVDKHSTGGVGDTVSLILAPVVASLGLKIGKLSGRGLGHTGGTIDKLKSIPGFRTNLSRDEFISAVDKVGLAIMGHTQDLVPADRKLYALRDVTGTIESIPFIIGSIMSKKIVCDPDGVVLDVKVGNGAFMKDMERANELAAGCKDIGEKFGLSVSALITDMNQPLANSVGNALEVDEAIEVLKDRARGDLREVSVNLAAELLLGSGEVDSLDRGLEEVQKQIGSGAALVKFRQFVESQGGNPDIIDDPTLLPQAAEKKSVTISEGGYVHKLEAFKIGQAAALLGAGRRTKDEKIDPAVGIRLRRRVGDKVSEGESVAWIHYNRTQNLKEAIGLVKDAFQVEPSLPEVPVLIKNRIR